MNKVARAFIATGGAIALALSLAGCFVIPLADGRSPFDDPFGPSKADVDKSIPVIEEALSTIDSEPYELKVVRGSDNCEGSCKLSPEVQFVLPDGGHYGNETPIPGVLIAEVMAEAIPAVDEMPLRISAYPGAGSLEEIDSVIADMPTRIGGLYYSAHSEELYIPADKLEDAKAAAEKYLSSAIPQDGTTTQVGP